MKTKKGRIEITPLPTKVEPHLAFGAFAKRAAPFFLDTGLVDCHGLGYHSFIGADPFMIVKSKGDRIEIDRAGSDREMTIVGNPFDALDGVLKTFDVEGDRAGLPFIGGAVGYLSYDLGRFVERLPSRAVDDMDYPDMILAFYDRVLAYDHRAAEWVFCRTIFDGDKPEPIKDEADKLVAAIESASVVTAGAIMPDAGEVLSNFTKEKYLEAVDRALEHIRAGDIYQVNLSQRFIAPKIPRPWDLYRRLRRLNAAPMAAYLGFDEVAVLSSSPERFLKVEGRRVETRPIKGTRPRVADPDEDMRHRRQLLASEKDRAELNMIVDLERNDLGRVCEYGSVKVTRHASLESYATVHHLVSTVEGTLRKNVGVVDLLKATFPGGSITGAPKIRSMEIIEELEPTKRSVYTGAIGCIDFNGDLDLNIAIRTILAGPDNTSFQVGGGIVADSIPEHEYMETLVKGKAIFETLKGGS